MTVMLIGIFAVFGVFQAGIVQIRRASTMTTAAAIADSEIEKFRADMVSTQRELRHVKRELRKDIDRLDGVLKFFNIAAVPLLVGLGSIGWAYRRRRTAGPAKQREEQGAGASHDA